MNWIPWFSWPYKRERDKPPLGFYQQIEQRYGKRVNELTDDEINEIRSEQGWSKLSE